MSIHKSKRFGWLIDKLSQCFDVDRMVAEKCVKDNKKKIDAFFQDPTSPPKLFFFYQSRAFAHPELYLSLVGDGDKLVGKCAYILRNTNKAVNMKVPHDDSVLFGELNENILQSFEGTISQVYAPMLNSQDSKSWGQITQDPDRKEFLETVTKFDEDLKRKIANLRGDVELATPQPPHDRIEQKPAAYTVAATKPDVLAHFKDIVTSWCEQITKYMEDDPSNTPLDPNTCDTGPDVEIEYWSRRMLTLISITEQLKTKQNRVVTGVLKARALDPSHEIHSNDVAPGEIDPAMEEQEQIKNLIERWREVDLAITDALNEAKDNVRFLENLRKVIEPLNAESPSAITYIMPSLMNSMKMIHTLSRHYGTEVRMTNLFSRITNQLINRCKEEIYAKESVVFLWKQDPKDVIVKMKDSITLCESYKSHYAATKENLSHMQKGKQFDFDETVIFGKFTRFRRRLEKLIDMFSSIQQFRALEAKRIDGMERLIYSFDQLINEFKIKNHDLLDFYDTSFERDFVEFTMHNSGLENAIQAFMESSLAKMSSIDKQLVMLKKFQDILHRDALQEDVEQKYLLIFKLYGEDLMAIKEIYETERKLPPIPRNMTRMAGNIMWARQLLRRITSPMRKFMQNPKVFHPKEQSKRKESKRIVRNYNKYARILIECENHWFQAWQRGADNAKRGLRSRLVVADRNTGRLYVNFDHGILTLIREAKHLQLMGFEIPNSAKVVLLLQEKLKSYYGQIKHALAKYHRITGMVNEVVQSLLRPHLADLELALRPAMTTMTWTSMHIDQFLVKLHVVMNRFEYLVTQINDIIENRISTNLAFVSNMQLLYLPNNRAFTLENFISEQRAHIDKATVTLQAKNVEIERAVDDLIDSVMLYQLDDSIPKTNQIDVNFIKLHYCHLMYHALLKATKASLSMLKNRIAVHPQHGFSILNVMTCALFEMDISLQVPNVTLSPNLNEVQIAVNAVARDVLACTRKINDWGLDLNGRPRPSKPFFDTLGLDRNLAIVLLLLTGSLEDTKKHANAHLSKYKKYDWLWKKDPEKSYAEFVKGGNRILEDFVAELKHFVDVEEEVKNLDALELLGSLQLRTDNLKLQLTHEIDRWKYQYSEQLHQEAKRDMEVITDHMVDLYSKLERPVTDFASLKFVMDALAEVREVASWVHETFNSIEDRYRQLDHYMEENSLTKDEMDCKSALKTQWELIEERAGMVQQTVAGLQGGFRKELNVGVAEFRQEVARFRKDYDLNGPMVKGITPTDAMNRLGKYKREYETLDRQYELYKGGEKLFGLPEQQYASLNRTRKELNLLNSLYTLYKDVLHQLDEYKNFQWSGVMQRIDEMNQTVEHFNSRCRKLPRSLKTWEAYLELSQTIEDFIELLPLLTELSKPAMRDRHWKQISAKTGQEFDLEKFHELKLRDVMGANLLEYREDIEDITLAAEKQLVIEEKLFQIQARWDSTCFDFANWKERGEVILAGNSVTEIVEQLEESQGMLVQMVTGRHVAPFKDITDNWLTKLSNVNDTLDQWIKVQMMWMSLEAVFSGGDIARQMPQDTRVFMKQDKEWTTRLMNKAKDVKNVVECCQNEYIKTMLPEMMKDLEKCQRALDGYLEAKRSRFPRFYFVSNPALLLILSQGSDKEAVQDCFSKVFDSIDRVEFQGNYIVKMRQLKSGFDNVMDSEDIPLTKSVLAKGNIEDWLNLVLREMARTMKDIVRNGAADEAMRLQDKIKKYCAQVTLLGIQFMWTSDVQEALSLARHSVKNSLLGALKKQEAILKELSSMTTEAIPTKMDRTKIETLVTIQVHQRDVLAELRELRLRDVNDFNWQKQLRCYWITEDDECVVKIADVDFAYCYEYLGCKERLVVTPLTDRCYIALSQAIGMCFGGAPAGPAGTGKTETVKDLGRALGKLVVVFNCSDQMHTADTAKIYKGLCQSGSWGCFDEFNRIDLEVLSVVAQQVQAILTAMRAREDTFAFPGDDTNEVKMDPRCGFFITMNPGYAGRQELPENLKALFRGVIMIVPDKEIIIRVKLASVGYEDFPTLSKKFRVLYSLCEEQLSKQRHYDFGLRNILSVLRTAGVKLRDELKVEADRDRSDLEEMLMMRTLRDMNLSKLVHDDVALFISLLHDLFPNQPDPPTTPYETEEKAILEVVERFHLVPHPSWLTKAIQLYETSLVRHGLMMCGPAGGGKTMATRCLVEALSQTRDELSRMVVMNPKAILAEQMFGQNDQISGEWTHGIFSSLWQKYNDIKKHNTWLVCDGPVDAIWIENLNTVLDDNKLLTLANGDRLPMTDNVRILFEVENLRNASPATVSRAGIIYVSSTDLGHEPVVEAWMRSRKEEGEVLRQLWDKYFVQGELLDKARRNTTNVLPVTTVHLVSNFLALLDGLLIDFVEEQKELKPDQLERLFIYSIIWSLGALLEQDDRIKFSEIVCEIVAMDVDNPKHINLPQDIEYEYETMYDFAFGNPTDNPDMEWERWEVDPWEFNPETFKFSTCLIPTVDSIRAEYLLDTMLDKLQKPVLVVGSSGTAKTATVLQYTNWFDTSKMLLKKVNFSSATTCGMFQSSIEADIDKRQGKTYAPPGGRWMSVFLDDLSMPEVNKWNDQPTLEIVRQLIESGGFYFLEKDKRGDKMTIENLLFIGAMSHPGGGRNDIPNRLKRHFYCFNMTPPSFESIDKIYGSMLRGQYSRSPTLSALVSPMTAATIDLWIWARQRLLPTPAKFHYIFNMRDLSRVFQGVLFSPLDVIATSTTLIELWFHECCRVFLDKLVDFTDKDTCLKKLYEVIEEHFSAGVARDLKERKESVFFVDFLRDEIIDEETEEIQDDAPKIYEPCPSMGHLRLRVEDFLRQYNEQSSVKSMDLVLFNDALEHLTRVARIIGMPRGNALLVGVGGSGRQSVTKLAAFIANHSVFQITLVRGYKIADFLEDIRKLFVKVGKEGQSVTWIVTDFEIVQETMLEYINAILATGEIAGLFAKDERDMMVSDLRGAAKKEVPDFEDTPDNLYKFFVDRIRDNLHIVLCFSPANDKFAERARRFPGLISGTTIDWFLKWPQDALVAVSQKFLLDGDDFEVVADAKVKKQLVQHIARVHDIVSDSCAVYFTKYRRHVHVTPKSYLSYIKSYKLTYKAKLADISREQANVQLGLEKLKGAENDMDLLQVELRNQKVELLQAEKNANAMLEKLEIGSKKANEKKAAADEIEAKCTETADIIAKERAIANKELEAAMPFVFDAERAASELNKKDISVIMRFGQPPDLIKRIMDCVLILNHRPLNKVSMTEIKVGRNEFQMFPDDSYDTFAKKMMVEPGFIRNLLDFANYEKDNINEETMEFLEPYLTCPDFNHDAARYVANAAESLCKWVIAMANYHTASLVVGPKLEELKIKTSQHEVAMTKLNQAQEASAQAQKVVDELTQSFQNTMKEKADLEQKARETEDKMQAAKALIISLSGEKVRWKTDATRYDEDIKRLVGDCALACAFVSYLGPFNHQYRTKLLEQNFYKDCKNNNIPVTKNLAVNKFLVDDSQIAKWNSEGLPKDELSIQNGILVTQASRYPLLIDPQGQAINWLKMKEAEAFPDWGTTTIANAKLRDQLFWCMERGKPLLIEGIVKDVDPVLDPVLERNVVSKGRNFFIVIGEKNALLDPGFRLYLVTKLSNPLFSPELSAKTTIIDFSVTLKGLEDQLLSRVIQREQKSLEDQRSKLIEEVNQNTISLQKLDEMLLNRLTESQGNLLDDVALITVLHDTKTKAAEVKEKIDMSKQTEININRKREQYRPVATRGSVLYFVIVSMSLVNCMYQTSLNQFLQWFDGTLTHAEPAPLVAKRVQILMKHLTYQVYVNIDRGLFEADKLTFKLMVTIKMLQAEQDNMINQDMVQLLLRGSALLSTDQISPNPCDHWLQPASWLNVCALSECLDNFFGDLRTLIDQNEQEWKAWYEAEDPEEREIPNLDDRLSNDNAFGAFMRCLVIRSFREDRTRLAAINFIGSVLGEEYTEPVPCLFEDVHDQADRVTPIILLLTPGADPTSQLEELARKQEVKIHAVSMGEGQDVFAHRAMMIAMEEGGWALLQNCHLGLAFMSRIEDILLEAMDDEEFEINEAFRLWITCEPHKDFSINLLQMSIKVTNEPPRGMKAGMMRSYTNIVDSQRLQRVETREWRDLVFCLCFLHSAVQERRKFGPIGWSVPYEFNVGDLEACLFFLEKHSFSNQPAGGLSWPTMQYMISEVQYGGRITDDFDRLLFSTFGETWLTPALLTDDFCFFNHTYQIPSVDTIEGYHKYINTFPAHDSPEIFGLHVNADLTLGTNEAKYLLNTISETQPKEAGSEGSGKTREEIVTEKAEEMLAAIPDGYVDEAVREAINKRPKGEVEMVLGYKPEEKIDGMSIPLNIFLYQEIVRLNSTIDNVRSTLKALLKAIAGEIIMTPELQDALNAVYDAKPPVHWYLDPSGAEIAWSLPSLSLWFQGLLDREQQMSSWLNDGRPIMYWMTGFFNPQGFLTATRQEITRRHKHDKWALDDVAVYTQVQDFYEHNRRRIQQPEEGVLIHGLFLEGANWFYPNPKDPNKDKKKCLVESSPKELFVPFPVLLVSAVTSQQANKIYNKSEFKFYDCPVYTKPKRTALSYVFVVKLRTIEHEPEHWILRGVALLCSKD